MRKNPGANPRFVILIDSNVFIDLENVGHSPSVATAEAATFSSLAAKLGASLALSEGTRSDILNASPQLRKVREKQITKYFELEAPAFDPIVAEKASFPKSRSSNDEIDLSILLTLASGAANWLVTNDKLLRKRASRAGFGDSVYSLPQVVEVLDSFVSKPSTIISVLTVKGQQVDLAAEIFEYLKIDYPEFVDWWRRKVVAERRDVLVLGSPSDPEGVASLKIESDMPHGLTNKLLKVSTFKTSERFQGTRRGELLLNAAIDYARRNHCERVYLEILPAKENLINWLRKFGFRRVEGANTGRGEEVYFKDLISEPNSFFLSPLDYNVAYGPGALKVENAHIVPIRPEYHSRLFPEFVGQFPLFPREEACGNAIRKAYLSRASSRQVGPGTTLIFVRTGRNSIATLVGVAEETLVSRDPDEIVAYVGNRTVYSIDEIRALCENRDVLAIRFRFDRVLNPPWPKVDLESSGALRGNPQSIQRVGKEGVAWIREKLEK